MMMSRERPQIRLVVDGGLHRGAEIALDLELTVGSDLGNSVILTDHGCAVGFAAVRDEDAVVLRPVDGPIAFEGETLAIGQHRTFWSSVAFESGGLAFRLFFPDRSPGRASAGFAAAALSVRSRLALGVIGAAALAAIGLPLAASSLPRTLPVSPSDSRRESSGDLADKERERLASLEALGNQMKDRLQNAFRQLKIDTVSLAVGSNGTVSASGKIPSSKVAGWSAAVRDFDTNAKGRVILINHVGVSDAKAPLQIRAAYPVGPRPYVIDVSNTKLFGGARLQDGWTIEAIEPKRVMLTRDKERLAVRFD